MTKLFSLFIILSFVLPVSGQEKLDSDKAKKEKAYHLTDSVREQGERHTLHIVGYILDSLTLQLHVICAFLKPCSLPDWRVHFSVFH